MIDQVEAVAIGDRGESQAASGNGLLPPGLSTAYPPVLLPLEGARGLQRG